MAMVCVILPESQTKHESSLFTSAGILEAVLGGPENLCVRCDEGGGQLPVCLGAPASSVSIHPASPTTSWLLFSFTQMLAWPGGSLALSCMPWFMPLAYFCALTPQALLSSPMPPGNISLFQQMVTTVKLVPETSHRVAQVGLCIAISTAWLVFLLWVAIGLGAGTLNSLVG